jgi:hypothetical protein
MPTSQLKYLTLQDLEDRIRSLEQKYEMTTADFLRDPQGRSKIREADALKWDAYIEFRRELRECQEELHHAYLSTLKSKSKEKAATQQVELAA